MFPYGASKSSMMALGSNTDVCVQLGWDADISIKPGDKCYLYAAGGGYYVSKDKISEESAAEKKESMHKKALGKAT